MLYIEAISALEDNYIWVIHDATNAIVIDPGQAEPILSYLVSKNIVLRSILLTHHHHDHIGGVATLVAHTKAFVYAPRDRRIVANERVVEGSQITLLDTWTLHVWETPGHTSTHVCYLDGNNRLFCGDTLFCGGCGRNYEGDMQSLYLSCSRLATLPDHTMIYCAHEYTVANLLFAQQVEPDNTAIADRLAITQRLRQKQCPSVPSLLQQERCTNPFLRCDQPIIQQNVKRHFGIPHHTILSTGSVFQKLRSWKDQWQP